MNRAVLEHEEALPEQRRTGFSIAFSYSPLLLFSVSDKTLLILLGTMKKNHCLPWKYSLLFSLVNCNTFKPEFSEKSWSQYYLSCFFFFFFQRTNISAFGIIQKYFLKKISTPRFLCTEHVLVMFYCRVSVLFWACILATMEMVWNSRFFKRDFYSRLQNKTCWACGNIIELGNIQNILVRLPFRGLSLHLLFLNLKS